LVRTLEWLTLLPATGAFPHTSQRWAKLTYLVCLAGVCPRNRYCVTFEVSRGF
jgi:hypothetical protein